MKTRFHTGRYVSIAFLCLTVLVISGCSIPNLETPECIEARPAVRRFYSFHFGNDMMFSADGLEKRSKFLTPRLKEELGTHSGTGDPFTSGDDNVPRAYRAGKCETKAPDRAALEILLLWRDSERDTQRTITVEMQKIDSEWLIDKVQH